MIDFIDHNQQHQHRQQIQAMNQLSAQQQPAVAPFRANPQLQSSNLIEQLDQQQQLQQQQQPQHDSISSSNNNNELIGYYFGSISRDTADWILRNHGNQLDGAYLLRSSGPNDDFVLSLMVVSTLPNNSSISCQQMQQQIQPIQPIQQQTVSQHVEILHYKIVETEDSFVALHGQVGDEKFATIDELIDKAQGVATKPRWPIHRQSLESQILPPTYWGLTVDQVRLAILIKAKQWGFPLLSSLFQPQSSSQQSPDQQQEICATQASPTTATNGLAAASAVTTTLSNETIRTLIYKSLHEFQPWFHGKISRDEAERRIEEGSTRDGKFLVRERDNYSYAMCICHRRATKHYRIDVLPTGELAIQDGRKFTSLMALVSHYTIMSDGLWCALTEACPRPIQTQANGFTTLATQTSLDAAVAPNGFFATANPVAQQQTRLQCGSSAGQNLYCVPPGNNTIGQQHSTLRQDAMATANGIGMVPLSNPKSGEVAGQRMLTNGDHSSLHHNQPNGLGGAPTAGANCPNAPKNSANSLVCTHPIAGVTSIKAPIKEWLQTINQKWSQLMASKNQHQSLNSFLFGSQNPLNNHCRHGNSRNYHNNSNNNNNNHHHHHNNHHHSYHTDGHNNHHRRKCKNGHTSCGCMAQQMHLQQQHARNVPAGAGGAATMTLQSQSMDQPFTKYQNSTTLTPRVRNNGDPCQRAIAACPATQPKLAFPAAHFHQMAGAESAGTVNNASSCLNNNSLLTCLPASSGFQLNGQSFIGSPLFAVRAGSQGQPSVRANNNNKTSSGSSNGSDTGCNNNIIAENEKLISPAQSISANLNNPYNLNSNDIYGSQPSTAIVNDNQPMTSSSSSSGTINQHNQVAHSNRFVQQQHQQQQQHLFGSVSATSAANRSIRNLLDQQHPVKQEPRRTGGQIMCGQHAGPAYRYTNCNDENSFKACFHRPMANSRALDDSQVQLTASSQLIGPAAMSKFVQFQDGQCLRTHRDTRSIQMAYLSSRTTANRGGGDNAPFRVLTNHSQPEGGLNLLTNNNSNNLRANQCEFSQPNMMARNNLAHANGGQYFSNNISGAYRNTGNQNAAGNSGLNRGLVDTHSACNNDIDLMDCGDADSFDFKVDPRLIKSSSIETLCGAADEEGAELDNVLMNCKSNSELMKSLQACFMPANNNNSNALKGDILKPIPMTRNQLALNHNDDDDDEDADAGTDGEKHPDGIERADNQRNTILSSLMTDNSEKLDYLKKKHDLDELYTAVFAELDASLKAQVDLKNKCLGFNLHGSTKANAAACQNPAQQISNPQTAGPGSNSNITESNPSELINEFDSLMPNNRSHNLG